MYGLQIITYLHVVKHLKNTSASRATTTAEIQGISSASWKITRTTVKTWRSFNCSHICHKKTRIKTTLQVKIWYGKEHRPTKNSYKRNKHLSKNKEKLFKSRSSKWVIYQPEWGWKQQVQLQHLIRCWDRHPNESQCPL